MARSKPKTNSANRGESHSPKAGGADSKSKRKPAKAQAGGTRNASSNEKSGVVSRIGKAISKVTAKLRPAKKREAEQLAAETPQTANKTGNAKAARAPRRESDIPLDRLASTYTPPQTGLKGGMRGNGADRQRDQEFARGVADDRWNDEDILTNKTNDPRIGTRGRSYEPGESRDRDEQRQ